MKIYVSRLLLIFFVFLSGCNFPQMQNLAAVPEPGIDLDSSRRPPGRANTSSPILVTLTPSPESLLLNAEIYGVDWLNSGDLLITLETNSKIIEEYFLMEGVNRYNCRISQDSDQLLFCVGQNAPPGKSVPIVLKKTENDQEVFKAIVVIPSQSSSSGSSGDVNLTQNPTNPPGPTSPPAATSTP